MAYQEEWQKQKSGNEFRDRIALDPAKKQEEEREMWKQIQARQKMQEAMLSGSAMAANLGGVSDGLIGCYGAASQCTQNQETQPAEREVHQAMQRLDYAIKRLARVVVRLDERTRDVQLALPEKATQCLAAGQPSSPLAQGIAVAITMLDDQAERLEAMERRIQL